MFLSLKRNITYWDKIFLNEKAKKIEGSISTATKLLSDSQMAKLKTLPACKMIARDFIHNSLYHPDYGYFSKQAQVFNIAVNINFSELQDNDHFMNEIASLYTQKDPSSQAWHTPTELFQPYYGIAVAKYLVEQFKLSNNENFVIFEIGAGNGTLMKNIMEYLKQFEVGIFNRSNYNIIEISKQLSDIQHSTLSNLEPSIQDKVEIFNRSIFEWNTPILSPCFFIGLEVLDNLSHDIVRYDAKTGEPYQAIVRVNESGDLEEEYTSNLDPKLRAYINCEKKVGFVPSKDIWGSLKSFFPFSSNLSDKRFVPTNCYLLFEVLAKYFPYHELLLSDFHELPSTIEGNGGPVVQTRYDNEMVPVSTYLVQPGYFDIFFPTDFNLLSRLYNVTNRKVLAVQTHRNFIITYGNLANTKTKSGDNPMVQYYQNVSFATTKLQPDPKAATVDI